MAWAPPKAMPEMELESEDQGFDIPEWIAEDVSDDPRYYNANLIAHPYRIWGEND
mgnify:CR=1 FL=1